MAAKFDMAKRKLRNKEKERSQRNLVSALFYSNSIPSAEEGRADRADRARQAHEEAASELMKVYSEPGAAEAEEGERAAAPPPSSSRSYMAQKLMALGYSSTVRGDGRAKIGMLMQKPIAVPVKLNESQKDFFNKQAETVNTSTVEVDMPYHNTKVMAAGRLTLLGSSWGPSQSSSSAALPPLEVAAPKPSPPGPQLSSPAMPSPGSAINTLSANSRQIDWSKVEPLATAAGRGGSSDPTQAATTGANFVKSGEEEEEEEEEDADAFDRVGSGDAVLRKAAQLLKFYKKEVEALATANKRLVTENFKLLVDNKNISTSLNLAVGMLEPRSIGRLPAVDGGSQRVPDTDVSAARRGPHDSAGGRCRVVGSSPECEEDSLGSGRSRNSHTSKRSLGTIHTTHSSSHSQSTVGAGSDLKIVPADLRSNKPSRLGQHISLSSVTDTARHTSPAQTVTKQYLADINNAYLEEKRQKLESQLSEQQSITESVIRRVRENYLPQSPAGSVSSMSSVGSVGGSGIASSSMGKAEGAARGACSKTSSTSPLPQRATFRPPYENLWVAIESFRSFREAQLAHEAISNDFRAYAAAQSSPQRHSAGRRSPSKAARSSGYGQSSTSRRRGSPPSRPRGGQRSSSSASESSAESGRFNGSTGRFNSEYSAVQIRYDLERRVWVVEGIKNSSLQLHRQAPAKHRVRGGGRALRRQERSLSSLRSLGSAGTKEVVAMRGRQLSAISKRGQSSMDGTRGQQQAAGGARGCRTMPAVARHPQPDAGQRERQKQLLVKRSKERKNAFFNAAQATLDSLLMSL